MARPVKSSPPARRSYDSSRRQEQARETRRRVIEAARASFLEAGYAQTTIAAVAESAGVSVETVYKAFANKPGLAKAVFDVSIVGDDEPVPLMQREVVAQNKAEPDPRVKLSQFADNTVAIAERTGALLLVLRTAASTDAGAAEVWDTLQNERLTGMTFFAQHLAEGRHLRAGVSVDEARDVLWAHTAVDLWNLLVLQRGWSGRRYAEWLTQQLIAALL
ncbi:MAG TPA: TetR/AcrR family transcriptional regulator [Mycobacteriales bacterium]|nr:TetR/AcrR family transcriptional regulator [Mycobacteriales bacterium]